LLTEILNQVVTQHSTTTTTTTTTTTVLRLSRFCLGQPRWASTRWNIHPLTPILVTQ